jgi:pre-mRNA-splicing factor RBM22/SLT11
MQNCGFDKECKVCQRPFTVFRWAPGPQERHRHTNICQTCAKIRNCCQCCVLDLVYSLPAKMRDTVLHRENAMPMSHGNRGFFVASKEGEVNTQENYANSSFSKTDSIAKEYIKKYARSQTAPYEKKEPGKSTVPTNVCPEFIRGEECPRGRSCPYRHDVKIEDYLEKNAFSKIAALPPPSAPEIKGPTIASLLITNIVDESLKDAIQSHFSRYGAIKSIQIVKASKLAFVNFQNSSDAKKALDNCPNAHVILENNAYPVKLSQKAVPPPPPKRKPTETTTEKTVEEKEAPKEKPLINDPLMPPPPPGSTKIMYPSMAGPV